MGLVLQYIGSMLGYMIVTIPFYVIGRFIYVKKKQFQVTKMREVFLGIFVLYVVGLASQTIIPYWHAGIITDTGKFYFDIYLSNANTRVNLLPFNTISQYFFQSNTSVSDWNSVSFLNVVANIFLFSPIGFFVPLLWKNWLSFRKILLLGLAVTCFIEFLQFFIGRSTDIDDVILNTVGVMIGYWVFYLFKFVKK